MPKYPRACNNRHFHEKWGSGESDLIYINLRRSGLSELAKTFESFLKGEQAVKSPTVTNICTDCLQQCLNKRAFTKYLDTSNTRVIETKLQVLLQNPAHKKNVNAPIVEVDDDSQVFTGSDEVITIDQEVANTPVAFGSPSFVTSTTTNQNSQDSEVTVTLSSPSQKLVDDFELSEASKTFQEKEVQTEKGIFISEEEFERLRQKAETCADFKKDLHKLCIYFSSMLNQCPEMDPSEFEKICKHVGAEKLLKMLYDLMSSERMSDERKNLTKLRAMVVIYIMMYSHSQRANWFQVTLARTLQQFGISDQGLASLRNLGVAAHPRTVKAASQSSATLHLDNVVGFFQEVVENEHFLVFCIDDYHNIHTKHRPEEKTQTQAVHMSTLLVKVFPNVKAVSKGSLCTPLLPPIPVQHKHLFKLIEVNMAGLSQSYATNMPDCVLAKYFDPEAERHRLLLHDYQQTEIQKMRSMENIKLIDSLHMPLKSYKDILVAFNHMLSNGLEIYLEKFLAPFMGDWPTQFFMRQVVYNLAEVSLPDICQNVVPLIGPLHISLNSRECVLKFFHPIFAELYAILFGKKAKLAKKPQAWRVSLLLEVLYGGWTLVRESILSVFCFCKDIEFLTLVNLVDNYVPLVLSIYSIVFKCNDYELYCKSLLRIWAMFMVFHRRHYDKAMLVVLSHFMYWQENSHPMYHTLHQALAAFDEYPVENFHSLLRARTNATDSAEQISLKAKEIDCCKQEMQSFQSMFVPPKKFHFSQKSISNLKVKAAEFLTKKFEVLHDNPGQAVLLPRVRGQNKETTKWQLPNLFGSMIVTNRVLPLGFSSLDRPPNPTIKCDKIECNRDSPLWRIFRGCGHSFHLECNLPDISACQICKDLLKSKAESLGITANEAVINFEKKSSQAPPNDDDEETSDSESSEDEDNDDDFAEQSTSNERTVGDLLSRIASWQHVQSPSH